MLQIRNFVYSGAQLVEESERYTRLRISVYFGYSFDIYAKTARRVVNLFRHLSECAQK